MKFNRPVTLKNGIVVVINPRPILDSTSIALAVKYGFAYESPSEVESAHFLEHMVFEGTETRSYLDILKQKRELGVLLSAYTQDETSVFFADGPRRNLYRAAEIVADMVENPTIPADRLANERLPMVNEYLERLDTPAVLIADAFECFAGGQSDEFDMHEASIEAIRTKTREEILRVHAQHYNPENMCLSFYGNISYKEAIKIATDIFEKMKKHPQSENPELRWDKNPRVRDYLFGLPSAKQGHIIIGFRLPPSSEIFRPGEHTFSALACAHSLLYERLYDALRTNTGLVYDVTLELKPNGNFGYFYIQTSSEPKNLFDVVSITKRELEKLLNGEFTDADIARAKRALRYDSKQNLESVLSTTCSIADYNLMHGRSTLVADLPVIQRDDVLAALNRYTTLKRAITVVLAPPRVKTSKLPKEKLVGHLV